MKFNKKHIKILIAAGLLLLTAFIASNHKISTLEETVFRFIYDWPAWLKNIMLIITFTGSSWMVVLLTVYFFAKTRIKLAFLTIVISLISYSSSEIIKIIIGRPRPFKILANVHTREMFITGNGFPSGHTTLVVALGLLFANFLPDKFKVLLIIWAVLVAVSRIYLGVHAPLDILGGASLGYIITSLFLIFLPLANKKFKK